MSEQRFTFQDSTIEKYMLYDNQEEDAYFISCDKGTINDLVDLLNNLNKLSKRIPKLIEENDNMNLFLKETIEPLLRNVVFELETVESMSQVRLAEKITEEVLPFIEEFQYLKYQSIDEMNRLQGEEKIK